MRDRYFDLLKQRAVDTRSDFLESPAAVIGTLVVSACVCAALLTVTVARIAPAVRLAGIEDVPVPAHVESLQARLGTLPVSEIAIPAIAGVDTGPERVLPASLPRAAPGTGYEVAEAVPPPPEPAPTVIAGRPPVDAIPRPARIEALAAAQRGDATAADLAALRPNLRPLEDTAPPATEIATLSPLATPVSPRPTLRPANLDVTRPAATTLAARDPEPAAEVTLASLPAAQPTAPQQFDRNANACSNRLARDIPRRSRGAAGGGDFAASLESLSGTSRDAAIAREVMTGNVPDFLRDLAPVSFTGVLPTGRSAQVTICVTPDYLAVGDDHDFMRVPLGLAAAARIAEDFNMMLPTTRMVDAIYAQADLRLSPSPMTPGAQMASTSYFMRHNATVQQQYRNAGGRLGMLVAGHKKDVVLTNRLSSAPGRVAIYGWHRANGNPIQPLSTVHGAEYADYSHGIRLVSRTAFVDGRAVDLRDLLMDGTYAGLLNTGGPIGRPAIQIASR